MFRSNRLLSILEAELALVIMEKVVEDSEIYVHMKFHDFLTSGLGDMNL